ncbi:MAG: DUF4112 domain-containing protein [Ferruginibacter sp.]
MEISKEQKALKNIEVLAKLMDNQFSIPGTRIRFGFDSIIGLIPGAGDLATFGVSGYMLWIMAQNGASGFLLARMVLNILIDTIVGVVPVIGDIFDIAFKANIRNMKLMKEHYKEGRHNGSAYKIILPVLIILFVIIAGFIWAVYKLLAYLF